MSEITSASSPSAQDLQNDVQKHNLETFFTSVCEFVNALRKKYKKDAELQDACAKFDTMVVNCPDTRVKDMLIQKMLKSWYKAFHPRIQQVREGKFECILQCEHSLLTDLKLKEKFQAAKISTRKIIMQYVQNISNAAEMFFCTTEVTQSLSKNLLSKIVKVSQDLQSANGMPNINQLIQVSQNLVGSLSQSEINSLVSLGKGNALQTVLQQLSSGSGGQQIPNMQNVQAIMSMLTQSS